MNRLSTAVRRASTEDGFSLIEVVVSLVLLGIVATGALYFFIQGTTTTSHIQRSQNAVAVANEAMESAFAFSAKDNAAVGAPQIVLARTQTAVQSAWTAMSALGVDGLADSYPVWDPTADGSKDPVLPITQQRSFSGQDYQVTVLVGSCFRASNVLSTNQTCSRLAGHTSDPGDAGTPAGMVRMLRVVTVVTWAASAGECAGSVCTYQLSGLIDRSDDLEWNQIVDPVAIADFETYTQGESRAINVLANDMIGPVTSNPVLLVSTPPAGHGTATVAANGMVTYTAPVGASGVFRFSYRIKDARGALSAPVDVEVTVLPESSNDTVDAIAGGPTLIPVTANDKGTPASLTITGGPSSGAAVVDGLNIRYTPSIPSGMATIRYQYTDVAGQLSPEATVTVLIQTLTVNDASITVPARSGGAAVWTNLTSLLKGTNANPSSLQVNITDIGPNEGIFRFNGGTQVTSGVGTGTTVEFSPTQNVIGEYTVQYRLVTAGGGQSAVRNLTIRVVPTAVGDNGGNQKKNGVREVTVGTNDAPNVFTAASNVTVELGSIDARCATFETNQSSLSTGKIRIRTVNSAQSNCSFQYTLVGAGPLSHLRSSTVTVTFRVTN